MSYPEDGFAAAPASSTDIFHEVESELERLRALVRIANCTNQTAVVRRLSEAIEDAESRQAALTFFGKPGMGAVRLAQAAEHLPPHRTTIHEAPAYRDIEDSALARARECDAAVFVISAAAPLFDDTLEFLTSDFSDSRAQRIVAIANGDAALAAEVSEALPAGVTACVESQLATLLTDTCFADAATSTLAELRDLVTAAARQLRPAVWAYAAFMALPQARYERRVDYIQRDLDALKSISRRCHDFFDRQIDTALAQASADARAIVPAMRQQAEVNTQQAPIPKDDGRNRFAQRITALARAAGYQEFERRTRSIAMRLNSARSILLTTMEQFRAEALPHLEELICNLGPELFRAWMREAGYEWAERPFDLSLDPGVHFPDLVLTAIARVRQSIPDQEFVPGWQSRLDAMLRNDMTAAATHGWTAAAIDGALIAAINGVWNDAAQRACGLLIGRLDALLRVVVSEVTSSRIVSLRLPRDPVLRRQTADVYRGFLAGLEAICSEMPA